MEEHNSNSIDDAVEKQARQSDQSWRSRLKAGKLQAGNLSINVSFLEQTGLLASGQAILEVGCGTGAMVAALAQKGYSVTGTDISKEAIAFGRQQHPELCLEIGAAEAIDFADHAFDVVLSFDVFEHIPHIDRHLAEARRVLRPGGYYLFQTPNKVSNIIFETWKSRSLRWRQYHPSLHTPAQLRRRLKRHGFTAAFVKMNTMNEFSLKKIKRLKMPTGLFARIDTRKLPLCMQTNLYVIARKEESNS